MKHGKLFAVLLVGAMSGAVSQAVVGEHLSEILVEEDPLPPETWEARYDTEELDDALPADAGEALRSVNGVSGSRMGGKGIDPVIRGQSQNQLNVLLDGAYTFGGCPNRMDPPTTYAPIESYDSVTVLKGFQTVTRGAGGTGGTVEFKRKTPRFSEEEPYRGRASAGYRSNSDTTQLAADVAGGTSQLFARGLLSYADAGNYRDGDGNTVRSAYNTRSGAAIFGWTPDDMTRVEGSVEGIREKDTLYAGAGMDSPKSDNDIYRLSFSKRGMSGPLFSVSGDIYGSQVDHVMDNYSLRPLTGPMAMKMRAPSTSDSWGGRLSGEVAGSNGWIWTFGADYLKNDREADRFAGPGMGGTPTKLQSILWPGVDNRSGGLFAEVRLPVSADDRLKAGLRYDRATADASRADQQAAPIGGASSPNDLYRQYYGLTAKKISDNLVSGFLRYEHKLGADRLLFGNLSRSMRVADANERFIASNAAPDPAGTFSKRWVGNPGIDPEEHLQAELGVSWDGGPWGFGASVFYDHVNDYILRDRAHGQSGILRDDDATIYRNVTARLWGAELEGDYALAEGWTTRLALAYVSARNTSDDRWIAQIPPLNGTLGIEYRTGRWRAGGNLLFSARQTRVDDDPATGSGLDPGETPGWGVVDLYGQLRLGRHTDLDLGVSNVFDRYYAYHVNRANVDPFNPDAVRVPEPGRAAWVRLTARF